MVFQSFIRISSVFLLSAASAAGQEDHTGYPPPNNPFDLTEELRCSRLDGLLEALDFKFSSYELFRYGMREGSDFRNDALVWERDLGFGGDPVPRPPIEGATCYFDWRETDSNLYFNYLECDLTRYSSAQTPDERVRAARDVLGSFRGCMIQEKIGNPAFNLKTTALKEKIGPDLPLADAAEIDYTPSLEGRDAYSYATLSWRGEEDQINTHRLLSAWVTFDDAFETSKIRFRISIPGVFGRGKKETRHKFNRR